MPEALDTSRRPRRRIVRRVLISATFGLLTTIAIATACAYSTTTCAFYQPTRSGERLTDPVGVEVLESADGTAPSQTQYFEFTTYELHAVTFGFSRLRPFQNHTPMAVPPKPPTPESVANRWQRAQLLPWLDGRRPWPDPKQGESIWIKAAGWPFRALACNPHAKNAPNFASHTWTVRGGIVLGNAPRAGWADWPPYFPTIIPLRPLWPELIADSALFGTAWGLALYFLTTVRHTTRARRGHCTRCNYDLRGLAPDSSCPECGLTRP